MATRPALNGTRRFAPARRAARGFTLIGLIFYALIIGFGLYVVVRTVPTVIEFFVIQRAVDKLAEAPLSTVNEIRSAFDRQKEVDFGLSTVTGRDLDITKENDRVVIRFMYKREIELVGPVYLMIKYDGRSH
jgi:type II secretory pathway pseudopilin PulG